MNIILKISLLSVIFVIISLFIKSYTPEFAFLLKIAVIIIIVFISYKHITSTFDSTLSLFDSFDIDSSHILLLVKIIGIAIFTDLITDMLLDNGEKAIANLVTMISKCIIILLSLPVMNGILVFCLKLLE